MMSLDHIKIEKLSRIFDKRIVLDDLSLNIATNEKVLLTGANGSGKSTFLRLLSTVLSPSSGTISFGTLKLNKNSNENMSRIRSEISWLPTSDRGFISRFTGQENLKYLLSLYKVDSQHLDSLLNDLKDIEPLAKALETPHYLCSSGMKQSLALTRAILVNRPFLFLDEPLRNLDEASALIFLNYLAELKNVTLIMSSHEVLLRSDRRFRILKFENGKLL
jgi:ABC-type multidrug transport system ATPase subunit